MTIDDLIALAKQRRDERHQAGAAEDFEDEAAKRYENEEIFEDDSEDAEAGDATPQTVDVKRKKEKRNAARFSISLDKNAETLAEALNNLTAAINAITPRAAENGASKADPPAVKISVTVNVDAAPLVNGLTDGVRAISGGEREGQLSAALRELLKDFHASRLSAITKKDAPQFLSMLDRRLEDAIQTRAALVLEEPSPSETVNALKIEQAPRPVETPQPETVTVTPAPITVDASQAIETPETEVLSPEEQPEKIEAPQREALSDDDAALLIEGCKIYASQVSPENRPKLIRILTRYGAASWKDIPRDKLTEAANAIIEIRDAG